MDGKTRSDTVFLCFDNGLDECWNCGGWRGAGGGPFAGDERFCSLDCASEHQEHHPTGPDYCTACGYDQHEHGPACVVSNPGSSQGDSDGK